MVGPHSISPLAPCFASRLHFKFLPNNLLGNKAPLVRNMYNSLTHLLKISNLHSIINIQKSLLNLFNKFFINTINIKLTSYYNSVLDIQKLSKTGQ